VLCWIKEQQNLAVLMMMPSRAMDKLKKIMEETVLD